MRSNYDGDVSLVDEFLEKIDMPFNKVWQKLSEEQHEEYLPWMIERIKKLK